MNISFNAMSTPAKASFKAIETEMKPLLDVEGKADNEVVGYSNWGGNYAFPITAGQIREQQAQALKAEAAKDAYKCSCGKCDESPEEYYQRKINSTEWMM